MMLQVTDIQTFYGRSQVLFGVSLAVDAGEVISLNRAASDLRGWNLPINPAMLRPEQELLWFLKADRYFRH
jgi:hypothetical protein